MNNEGSGFHRLLQRTVGAFSVFFLLLFLGLPAAAQQAELDRADALMKAGRPAEAYALLEPLEDKYAGDPRFDYLLGIAALDSGKADKATLAFERVLAVNPDFAGARLDLARAYFQLGDISRAKAEFETVLTQNPPEAARVTIRRYLEAIAQRERAAKTVVRGYLEGTLGRDTNVNNSTSQSQINVPALGNLLFTLDPSNVKRADYYSLFGGGAEIAHEVTPGFALFGGVDLRYRSNSKEDRFDYRSGDVRAGVTLAGDANIVRVSAGGGRYDLDHQPNRGTLSFGADWRHVFNPSNHLNVFTQYNQFRFEGELSVNNFDQTLLGIGWLRLFAEGKSALSATLFGGTENDTNDRADGNKRYTGLRLGGQLNLRDNLDLFGAAGAQRGTYDKQNVAFQRTREDDQLDVTFGLNWRLADRWILRPQVLYVRNDSNIPIYTYKRIDAAVTLRREF